MKHLYFKDYKHLKDVSFDDNVMPWELIRDILVLITAFIAITLVLFLN